ncbi:aminotransferase class I/II-fold pyridoxal phosphate-dependent enzyme [Lapillicoccus jejuensis]|uniref:dTDP-4-amino-4,6-dideoxygalactose transaminase n=1 Tax=Lapillicoccus jejuensis TaxID=402171 RepID=A0A542DW15_9MICO|nr:aminotransferase class I/II-fold pyridoxal phosphate-dependent enzyme [Lapillicoccus jejuensis]TQJ07273.1 dTDP-4-amino-4,6-dideoxygalactose transaminase [Lapillicoccus jejuensis]
MTRVLLSQADVTVRERDAVAAAVMSGWVAPLGPEVDAFEAEMAERSGVRHALALSSGTAALHLGLLGLGAGPDTVVVVPSLTFAASANAVTYTGATPYFVDSREDDGTISVDLLERALSELRAQGRRVAAVMPVDLLGRTVEHDALRAVAASFEVPVIVDAAESVGATYHGRPAPSFGAVSAISFNGNKIMTTSGGGMLLSDDADLVARARYLSTQARRPVPWYEHTETGYNYRLSNVLAALGRVQLSRLDEMMARRRAIRQRYARAVVDLPGVRVLGPGPGARDDTGDNCWLTALVLDDGARADRLVAALDEADIEGRALWKPMHLQPLFAQAPATLDGTSERLFRTGVTLPSGSSLDDAAVDRVVVVLRHVLGG